METEIKTAEKTSWGSRNVAFLEICQLRCCKTETITDSKKRDWWALSCVLLSWQSCLTGFKVPDLWPLSRICSTSACRWAHSSTRRTSRLALRPYIMTLNSSYFLRIPLLSGKIFSKSWTSWRSSLLTCQPRSVAWTPCVQGGSPDAKGCRISTSSEEENHSSPEKESFSSKALKANRSWWIISNLCLSCINDASVLQMKWHKILILLITFHCMSVRSDTKCFHKIVSFFLHKSGKWNRKVCFEV